MAVDLIDALMQTQALKIAPPGQVFWYTSGTVGPYYINTHYLYGGPEQAEDLLTFIDTDKEDRARFALALDQRTMDNVAQNEIYRAVVEQLVQRVRQEVGEDFDYISGGERRDWFFSPAVAAQLGKGHLLIYKDKSMVSCEGGEVREIEDLHGRRTVHIADLVTEASSYTRAWIPAIRDCGGQMVYAANVVDRAQGGLQAIEKEGVGAAALVRVDEALFASLLAAQRIDMAQRDLLVDYYRDPHAAMKTFIEAYPQFLRQALAASDERTTKRAQMLVEENPYQLDLAAIR
jgi:orotate phosphoribosyltransferase